MVCRAYSALALGQVDTGRAVERRSWPHNLLPFLCMYVLLASPSALPPSVQSSTCLCPEYGVREVLLLRRWSVRRVNGMSGNGDWTVGRLRGPQPHHQRSVSTTPYGVRSTTSYLLRAPGPTLRAHTKESSTASLERDSGESSTSTRTSTVASRLSENRRHDTTDPGRKNSQEGVRRRRLCGLVVFVALGYDLSRSCEK